MDQFRDALSQRDIIPPSEIIADGKIHRCDATGKNGRGDAAYLLHGDGVPAGGFENHRDGQGWENWHADVGRQLSPTERREMQARIAAQRQQREQYAAAKLVETQGRAKEIWESASATVGDHPYLNAKGVGGHKARICLDAVNIAGMDCDGALVVPMRNSEGVICQLQLISPKGEKRFLPGPKGGGLYYSIGSPSDVVCVAEGFATAASIHEATGHAVAVAFDCGNLEPVGRVIRAKFPDTRIVLCADDDYQTHGNPGVTKATAAARAVGASLAVPDFGADRPDGAKDFNDLARLRGKESVKRCMESALQMKSEPSPTIEHEPMAELVSAASLKPEPINWLWNGWLAAGKFHLLAGAPGTGKTTVAMAFAATLSCAGRWPDGSSATAGDVLMWSSEDDPKDTLIPRLIAMGADRNRIHFVTTASDGDRRRAFDPATDTAQLQAAIKAKGINPRLLIVDPVVSAVRGDSNQGSQTRRSLQPLVDLGASESCAILGISHFSKGTAGNNPTERVTGSIAFAALARIVMVAAKMSDEQGGGRFIARSKSNISVDSGGYGYELRQDALQDYPGVSASTLLWGDAIEGNARDMLEQAELTEDSETRSQNSEAVDWLLDQLRGGPMKATDVTKEAKAAGMSDKSVRTARKKLGVTAKKQAFSGCWMLQLPADEGAHQDAQGAQDALILKAGAFDRRTASFATTRRASKWPLRLSLLDCRPKALPSLGRATG